MLCRFLVSPIMPVIWDSSDWRRWQYKANDRHHVPRPTTLYRFANWVGYSTHRTDRLHRINRTYFPGLQYTGRADAPYRHLNVYRIEMGHRMIRLGDRYLPLAAESLDFFRNNPEFWYPQAPLDYGHIMGCPFAMASPYACNPGSELYLFAPARCLDHDYIRSAMSWFPDMLWTPRPYSLLAFRSVTVAKLFAESVYDFDYLHLLTLDVLRLGAHHCIRGLGGYLAPRITFVDLTFEELRIILRAASSGVSHQARLLTLFIF